MELKQLIADLKAAVEAQRAEIAKFGRASEASEAKVAKLSQQLEAVQKELDDVRAVASKGMARGNRIGAGGESKSLGARFVESPEFKAMKQSNARSSAPVTVGSFRTKAPLTTTGDAAAMVQSSGTERIGSPIARPERQFRLRDIMLSATTSQNAIEYVEETGFYHLHAEVASTAASGQADIIVENSRGFFPGQTIVIADGTPAKETKVIATDGVDHDTNTLTVTTNLANSHAAGVSVTSDKFVFTPETKLKPNASVKFELLTATVKTLAHALPASRQVLNDLEGLRAHIDGRLVEGLMLSEEYSILYGDGSNDQLQGIMTHPRVQSYAWSSGPATDTKLDALRRAITLANKANYPVDAIVIGDDDWEDIELAKGSDGHYIWVTVVDGGQPRVWRVPVVITNAMASGDALVGAFGLGIALWDREEASIRIAEQHADYFAKNMVLILAEERITTTLYRPEAFVKVDLSTAPVAEE